MDIGKIKELIGRDLRLVNDMIVESLKSDIPLLNKVNESILQSSGKQMRPILALLVARACNAGQVSESTIRYAAAAELLHNATLFHDDVADSSDYRRGRPTVNKMMGPSVSVLIGDYWLVRSMDLILRDSDRDPQALKIFSKTLSDLAEGEMLQLQKAQSGDTVEEDYFRIIYNKTASLFEAAIRTAALSVRAAESVVQAVIRYAVSLGTAFQIKDDILDYTGTESVGKPLGVDIQEQKITLPLLGAFKNVSSEEESHVRKKIKDISDGNPVGEILDFVKTNGGIAYAAAQLDKFVEQAVSALDIVPDSEEKKFLIDMAYYTALREK